jgi:hypothetical protein
MGAARNRYCFLIVPATSAATPSARTFAVASQDNPLSGPSVSVGEEATIRFDPRDLGEIWVFYKDRFPCRAISAEFAAHAGCLRRRDDSPAGSSSESATNAVTHAVKSNTALRLIPKFVYTRLPALDRIS